MPGQVVLESRLESPSDHKASPTAIRRQCGLIGGSRAMSSIWQTATELQYRHQRSGLRARQG